MFTLKPDIFSFSSPSCSPKINWRYLIAAIKREFTAVINEYTVVDDPIAETFVRLTKKDYSKYSIALLAREWKSIRRIASLSKKNGAVSEQDKIVCYIMKKEKEYKAKKNWLLHSTYLTSSLGNPNERLKAKTR